MTEIKINWSYGMFQPLDWDASCDAEMRRMNNLWNKLVEIERANAQSYDAIMASGTDRPELMTEHKSLVDRVRELRHEMRQRRVEARSKKVKTTEIDAELKRINARLKEIAPAVRAAKDSAKERTAERRRALEASRQTAVKAARRSCGCYWGNYNAVINSYEDARKKVFAAKLEAARAAKNRKSDNPEGKARRIELHFRKFDGTGRIVNQIQGGITTAGLFSAVSNQVSIRPATPHEWRGKRLPIMKEADRRRWNSGAFPLEDIKAGNTIAYILSATVFTVDRKPKHVRFPFILDRPFPADAEIKEVHITRRHRGPVPNECSARARPYEWSVAFSIKIKHDKPINSGQACGIDIGWRRLNDGLRVAAIINERGERDFIAMPEQIIDGIRYANQIQSERDGRKNEIVTKLRTLSWTEAPQVLRDTYAKLGPRPKAGGLSALTALWKQHEWQQELREELRDMLLDDRDDWMELAGLLRRVSLARREHYRICAKRIATNYGLIGMEKLSIKRMAEAEDSDFPDASRFYRRAAAPYELISAIRWASAKYGSRIHEHEGLSTWRCHECGHKINPTDRSQLVVQCPNCMAVWDQDVNAARNLLAAALATPPVAKEDSVAVLAGRWGRAKAAAERARRSREQ